MRSRERRFCGSCVTNCAPVCPLSLADEASAFGNGGYAQRSHSAPHKATIGGGMSDYAIRASSSADIGLRDKLVQLGILPLEIAFSVPFVAGTYTSIATR